MGRIGYLSTLPSARGMILRWEKNPVSKRAGFGPQVKTHGLGPGMEKPSPNPIRCHS